MAVEQMLRSVPGNREVFAYPCVDGPMETLIVSLPWEVQPGECVLVEGPRYYELQRSDEAVQHVVKRHRLLYVLSPTGRLTFLRYVDPS